MSNTFFGLSLDCSDAASLSQFWGTVLGREVVVESSGESAVITVDARGVGGPRSLSTACGSRRRQRTGCT